MDRFADGIVKFRWWIILGVLGITVFLGLQISKVTINPDVIASLPDTDPVARLYKEIGEEFNGNDLGIIALEGDDVFTADMLRYVQEVTDSVRFTTGVLTVTSLTNILDIRSSEWGIEIGKLIAEDALPRSEEELESLRRYVLSREMYRGTIVSEDATSTAVIFTIDPGVDKKALSGEIRRKIMALQLPVKLYFGGLPMMLNDINDLILKDIVWLIPIVALLIIAILTVSFRTYRGVLLPLLNAGIAVIWTIGLMPLMGKELTIITNAIPVVLLAVGSAYSIHVMNSFMLSQADGQKKAVSSAVSRISAPVFMAASTTIVGFISFIFGAYLSMIRDFGIFSALGTTFALLLSIFFGPALLAVLPDDHRKPQKAEQAAEHSDPDPTGIARYLLLPLTNFVIRHFRLTVVVWLIVILAGVAAIFRIETSVNLADYFKKNNPTRIAEEIMQRKFGGSLPVFLVFNGDVQDPEVLKMMQKAESYMKTNPNVRVTQSVADLIEELNDAMGEGKTIPDDHAKIEQLWFLLEGQEVMTQLVNEDLTRGVVQARFASVKSQDTREFTAMMEKFISEQDTVNFSLQFTGMPPIYVNLHHSLIRSQYTSLIIAVISVVILVGVTLKSLRNGILAAIPVAATVILLFGFMGLSGIPLDIATVLVASVALGIGIDYSIHIITGVHRNVQHSDSLAGAIRETVLTIGKAVVINVLSVASGFTILLFSQLIPLQHFGLLVTICMIVSGFGALTLLPALLMMLQPITRKQIVEP